jgi:hypothetical protein
MTGRFCHVGGASASNKIGKIRERAVTIAGLLGLPPLFGRRYSSKRLENHQKHRHDCDNEGEFVQQAPELLGMLPLPLR